MSGIFTALGHPWPRGISTSLCVTHRCHQKEFLLKFVKDRQRWRYWLFEAKKRYGLSVLNYIVTSNHIHLLVRDRGQGEIAQSMQLIAGRTAQEYNQRKERFWNRLFVCMRSLKSDIRTKFILHHLYCRFDVRHFEIFKYVLKTRFRMKIVRYIASGSYL